MKKLIVIIVMLTGLNLKAQTGISKIDQFINEWVGKPYRFGGTTKSGIDCSAFTQKFYKQVLNEVIERVAWAQWDQTLRIDKDSLAIGDIVFFNSKLSPSGWHCGIYIGENKFVHAANVRDGVKISSLSDERYKESYKGAGRIKP
jgi:murein DD-endopeptidase / murein LD-carboxypeptidase